MTLARNASIPGPIVEIQRARIVDAMIEVCRERGANAATVAHVVDRAGVSRRTFYELFSDREACFLAAFEEAVERARQRLADVWEPQARWRVRIRAALMALLELFEDEPAIGRLLTMDSLSAGPNALKRRSRLLAAAMAQIDSARKEVKGARGELTALTGEGLVGAALAIVHARLSEDEPGELRKLLNPLMAMLVLPYFGTAASGRELAVPLPPRRPFAPRPSVEPLRGLQLRLTYRTIMVLRAIAARPGASNRQVGKTAGIDDQGQISKLLARLERLGLVSNNGADRAKGMPNAWTLTSQGDRLVRATDELAGPSRSGAEGAPAARARPRSSGA